MTDEDVEILSGFRARLPIDQFDLEKENAQQPALYDDVGKWVSGVKAEAKIAKEHIEYARADLSSKIRKNPEEYGLTGKITNDVVGTTVTISPEYQKAVKDSISATRLADEASTLLTSVEQRKSAINNLVRLFVHAYFFNDKLLNTDDWRANEEAINDMRTKKAQEEAADEENLEEG